MNAFVKQLHKLLDLRVDTDYERTDESIRQNVSFKSANAWTLVFAIFIASVGLNVNSTAVIIGAMLISPLMGPIVGAGYALGINDFLLLKNSGRNLLYAICISLVTSTVYFLLSPFNEAQSELIARSTPNFYDVVIAVFGGAAGIVAMSRTEKSNAIPGVAIATALMPPLCTAGFGIATLEWKFFVGALYLFVINSVFICLSTYVFVKYLRFKKVSYSNPADQRKINRWIVGISVVVIIPSIVTAWLLLEQSRFRLMANKFIDSEVRFKSSFLVDKKVEFQLQKRTITLTFIGSKLSAKNLEDLQMKKDLYGLKDVKLEISQVAIDDQVDAQMSKINRKEVTFKQRLADLEAELKKQKDLSTFGETLLNEAKTFSPQLTKILVSDKTVVIVWNRRPKDPEKKVLEKFLGSRTGKADLQFEHSQRL